MSWLDAHKQKFAAEAAEKAAREQKERDECKARHDSAYAQLKQFIDLTIKDLVGKKTKDDKTLRLELDNERHCATMFAGDEKFLYMHFWYKEHERYDNDGCSWGDGTYYLSREVHYILPHKDRHGYEQKEGKWGTLYDEDLAHYLLAFI